MDGKLRLLRMPICGIYTMSVLLCADVHNLGGHGFYRLDLKKEMVVLEIRLSYARFAR